MATRSPKRNTGRYGRVTWYEPTTPLCLLGQWISCEKRWHNHQDLSRDNYTKILIIFSSSLFLYCHDM